MNKGFFVVFLGIILGAMALIFVNQASAPAGGAGTYQAASGETGNADGTAGEPVTVASNDAPGTRPPAPEAPQAPTPPTTAPVKPEPAKPEPPKPEPVQPVTPPAPQKPEPAKPEAAAPETVTPEPVKPEPVVPVTPEPAKPEPAKPEPVAPAKPETQKPETPTETAGMTPVTSTPETPAPVTGQAGKSLTLVNIGLHFKGSGMALRIEADAPFSYKTFALPSPDRYVVDLVGTWNKMRAPSVPSNNMIKGARAGKQAGGPRLVLDMQRSPKKHSVTWVTPTVLEIVIE